MKSFSGNVISIFSLLTFSIISLSKISVDFFEKNAPAEIQELFSRNELIKKFAETTYLLSSPELDTLLGEANHLKIKQYSLFEWRNWRLIPKDKKYWIIEKKEF